MDARLCWVEKSQAHLNPADITTEVTRSESMDHQCGSSPPMTGPIHHRNTQLLHLASIGEMASNNRALWLPDNGLPPNISGGRSVPPPSSVRQRPPASKPVRGIHFLSEPNSQMMLHSETRHISQDEPVATVKDICASLVDNAQSANADASKLNEPWKDLIAHHRTLLHEHHDFLLAVQLPSASTPLQRLANKYAMPARMWRHGIECFLEALRYRMSESLEHITFLHLVMPLLHEAMPEFEDTWIECLGDLGRYPMAIEDDDVWDREVWTGVSRHWYSKASDKAPTTGRLYHHLTILARPNALQQLYYYIKSLCVPVPFLSARESVMTMFDPVLSPSSSRLSPIDASFARVHVILFLGKSKEKMQKTMQELLDSLDRHIGRTTKRWLKPGYFTGISLGCPMLGYRAEHSFSLPEPIPRQRPDDTAVSLGGTLIPADDPGDNFATAQSFTARTFEAVHRSWGDTNALPFLHTALVFMNYMQHHPTAMRDLEKEYPWKLTAIMLNSLLASSSVNSTDKLFPPDEDGFPRPLPEDYAMRGLAYPEDCFPPGLFINEKMNEDDRYLEFVPMTSEMTVACIDDPGLARLTPKRRLSSSHPWLTRDMSERAPQTTQVEVFFIVSQVLAFFISSGYLDLAKTPPPISDGPRHGVHGKFRSLVKA